MPNRSILLIIVFVYERKNSFYKIYWHQQDLSYVDQHGHGEPPLHPHAATYNIFLEIEICLFVKPSLLVSLFILLRVRQVSMQLKYSYEQATS